MLSRNQIIILASVAAVAVGGGFYWKTSTAGPAAQAVTPAESAKTIADAKQKAGRKGTAAVAKTTAEVEMIFERQGTNALALKVKNPTQEPFAVSLAAGTVFEDGKSGVILLKPFEAKVEAGGNLDQDLAVVALSSANQSDTGKFTKTSKDEPRLAALLQHLESHSAVPVSVVQTAALAILEDAPAGLFARFPRPLAGDVPAIDSFRVDTYDIVAAIQLLREIGVDSSKLAQDAQLKVEATIDLKAHDIAMYYGISREAEWQYWTRDVMGGDPTMRHYALYGIARFYPDVALQMMPKWAKEARIAPHYRRAAVGALALTQKPEARALLQALEQELAADTALAQKVEPALRYLEQNLPSPL
jgi:hypothetical protein